MEQEAMRAFLTAVVPVSRLLLSFRSGVQPQLDHRFAVNVENVFADSWITDLILLIEDCIRPVTDLLSIHTTALAILKKVLPLGCSEHKFHETSDLVRRHLLECFT